MTYEPVDIVDKLNVVYNATLHPYYKPVGDCIDHVEAWRDALVAELERLVTEQDTGPYDDYNNGLADAYRHAARLVRGET
jgi:hypothetical protein